MHIETVEQSHLLPPRVVLPLFAATLFLSAGLMFFVEPMVGKMVLPRLGGSPAVWSTCLLFFQAILLLSYAYAHASARFLPRWGQIALHLGIVLPLAGASLPIDLGTQAPSPGDWPGLWLLARLAVSVGPAVFCVAATAPLLQNWFSSLDHEAAGDPYFLYAGSNAGSLLALLAYPLIVEPALPLNQQSILWALAFGALAVAIAMAALVSATATRSHALLTPMKSRASSARERLTWTALAFVPSSLLLGVTAHISTDIASAPLLWVVPLALYLLTFILAFSRHSLLSPALMVRVLPMLVIPVAVTAAPGLVFPLPVLLALHLGCLFVISLLFHGELARLRPGAARLTEFYLFLSIGGVLGGIFNALVAPVIFPDLWEYPLVLIIACLLKPSASDDQKGRLLLDILLPLGVLVLVWGAHRMFGSAGDSQRVPLWTAIFGFILPGMALLNFSTRRVRFALGVAGCFIAASLSGQGNTLLTARSFFGVYRVQVVSDQRSHYLIMMHGTTLHGVRSLASGEEMLPVSYYDHEGSWGHFFRVLPAGASNRVAVVGLGIGGLGCYARTGEKWTFYEIDPLVEKLARDPGTFQFMQNCGNNPDVVIGDARLRLADAADGSYDLLILDAFSSNSIPIHLITREAIALYIKKLAPHGHLLLHISNRSLDLAPLVSALVADAGLSARTMSFQPPPSDSIWRHAPSELVAVGRNDADLSILKPEDGWQRLSPADMKALWTDQRSDLLQVMRFKF